MQCLECRGADRRWNEFVRTTSAGTFFHLLEWRDLVARHFGYQPFYLYVEEKGEISAVLPLFLANSLLFGRNLISIPVGIYGGVVSRKEEATKLLLRRAQELAHECRASHLEIRGNPYGQNDSVYEDGNGEFRFKRMDHHVTFIREIDSKEENNFARIPRKQRRMIRQAQKHGLRSFVDDSRLLDCFQIYAESLRNLGTPVYSYKYFQDLKKTFGDHCRILRVEYQSKIIAGVLSFFYKDQVLPYYGGALKQYFHLAPNDFMYWELMSYGGAKGYRTFDFGRSKRDTGSFDFKRHWGFDPLPLPYLYYAVNGQAVPDSSSLNSKLQWAIKLWRRLPLRLTMAFGPHIAPHLPW